MLAVIQWRSSGWLPTSAGWPLCSEVGWKSDLLQAFSGDSCDVQMTKNWEDIYASTQKVASISLHVQVEVPWLVGGAQRYTVLSDFPILSHPIPTVGSTCSAKNMHLGEVHHGQVLPRLVWRCHSSFFGFGGFSLQLRLMDNFSVGSTDEG